MVQARTNVGPLTLRTSPLEPPGTSVTPAKEVPVSVFAVRTVQLGVLANSRRLPPVVRARRSIPLAPGVKATADTDVVNTDDVTVAVEDDAVVVNTTSEFFVVIVATSRTPLSLTICGLARAVPFVEVDSELALTRSRSALELRVLRSQTCPEIVTTTSGVPLALTALAVPPVAAPRPRAALRSVPAGFALAFFSVTATT